MSIYFLKVLFANEIQMNDCANAKKINKTCVNRGFLPTHLHTNSPLSTAELNQKFINKMARIRKICNSGISICLYIFFLYLAWLSVEKFSQKKTFMIRYLRNSFICTIYKKKFLHGLFFFISLHFKGMLS